MMRSKQFLLLSLILVCLPAHSYAQNWSGIVDPTRAIDWSGAGVVGGIPTRNTICTTLSAGVTATTINNAIASCPAGQVVFLNAGTYNLSAGITFEGKSNVTLRGAGANQTKLVFTGDTPCGGNFAVLCIKGSSGVYNEIVSPVNWTAGYAKGTTQITLSSVAGLSVGQFLVLDQCNDGLTGASCTGTEVDQWPDMWNCAAAGPCSIEGAESGDKRRDKRGQEQIVKITAINGSQVTITPGLYLPNWKSARTPQAWTWGTIAETSIANGVENLSIDFRNAGTKAGVTFWNAYSSWIKGIRSIGPASLAHVLIFNALRSEIRDCYFFGSGGASTSYGILPHPASDTLVINNIWHHVVSMMHSGSGTGNVFAYNYGFDTTRGDFPTSMGAFLFQHEFGISMILWEGNQGTAMQADTFHGTANFITAFRNQLTGSDQVNFPSQVSCTQPVSLWSFHRFYNVIGNVLGESGYHDIYESAYPSAGSDTAIFDLGHHNACGSSPDPPDDTHVKESLLRWGNYDVVTRANRFVSSEVPTGLTKYANPVPASQALPASFFLSAQPFWWVTPWGTPAWPPVGPDVTSGNVSGYSGRVWKNPARLCFENSAVDPAYGSDNVRVFNARNCYASPGSPGTVAPPTNLRVVP